MTPVFNGTIIEGASAVLLHAVRGFDGEYITQSDVSSITAQVFDRSTDEQVGDDFTLTVSTTVYNTLQTDARWTTDDVGYNFAALIPGDYFLDGKRTYRVEITYVPVDGLEYGSEQIVAVWNLKCINRMGL